MPVTKSNVAIRLKAIQDHIGAASDGLIGPESLTRMETALGVTPPAAAFNLTVSRHSLDQLVFFEITSEGNYNRNLKNPTWPGGESGITIGIGYDLGFNTAAGIRNDWSAHIPADDLQQLMSVAGKKGNAAKTALSSVRSLVVPLEAAKKVFYTSTLPRFAKITANTYPGAGELFPDAQGALVSLIYNRGGSLSNNDRRKEMRHIKILVPIKDYAGIAMQFRSMKRLWDPAKLAGLIKRREKEAVLVENADRLYSEEEKIRI